ncbi:MAG: hypothetical protein JWO49_2481 [Arthrobacter sp.]|nr:hypothetical protein [Arthrobacter sp.]
MLARLNKAAWTSRTIWLPHFEYLRQFRRILFFRWENRVLKGNADDSAYVSPGFGPGPCAPAR